MATDDGRGTGMQLTLLGATGPTGQHILRLALRQGHRVTALVRDPARLPQQEEEQVTVVAGDATRTEDVVRTLRGSEAVLCALGPGRNLRSNIASRAARALIPAAHEAGVRRVVVLSAFGVGETLPHYKIPMRTAVRLVMANLFRDKGVADDLLRSSDLDWTLVYPTVLTNGPATGSYTVLGDISGRIGGRISRADVADFMLRQVGSTEWSRRTAILTH
jgi:uncharacterized protein YbjT (DUF2867 family)